jgi:hypothetical protein
MLILTRRVGEVINIGDDVTVTVLGVKGNQVRVGVKGSPGRCCAPGGGLLTHPTGANASASANANWCSMCDNTHKARGRRDIRGRLNLHILKSPGSTVR